MESWICPVCKQYIPVNHKMIQVNDIVIFRNVKTNGKVVERSEKNRRGKVTERDGEFLKINSRNKIYRIHEEGVTPIDAPMELVYNMFGHCRCPNPEKK